MNIKFDEIEVGLIKELLELENIKFSKDNIEIYLTSLVQDRLLYKKAFRKPKNSKLPF